MFTQTPMTHAVAAERIQRRRDEADLRRRASLAARSRRSAPRPQWWATLVTLGAAH